MRFCRLKETQFYVYTRETDQTPITVLAIQVSHNDCLVDDCDLCIYVLL